MGVFKDEKYRTILEASEEELQSLKIKSEKDLWKPIYHIHPQYGLLNDPNGLAYYNGEYHFFHQWYPFGTTHGMKHWAHLKSNDLVNWERLPVAIIPTEEYESHGAYSGNSLEINGHLYLYYTGNIKYDKENRNANQCLAIMNKSGSIEKYENNPIIKGVPDGYTGHVRDPKVFKHNDYYFMLLGAQRVDETGAILIYKSFDGLHWNFNGELKIVNFNNDFGYMWECPDYIKIDGKDVIIISPQGLSENGDRYKNLFNVIYAIGELDLDNLEFTVESYEEMDRGFDFYAPQSFRGKNNEVIISAWAGLGEFKYPTDKAGWAHLLTFPRKLNVVDGLLVQNPVVELEKLIEESTECSEAFKKKVIKNNSNNYHIKFEIQLNESKRVDIKLLSSDEESLNLELNRCDGTIVLDRSNLKHLFVEEYGLNRRAELKFGDKIDIEILVDSSIVEIFIDKGKIAMTSRVFPLEKSTDIEVYSDSEIKCKYIKNTLKRGIR